MGKCYRTFTKSYIIHTYKFSEKPELYLLSGNYFVNIWKEKGYPFQAIFSLTINFVFEMII